MKRRHQIILDRLEERGASSYQELSEQLGVSTMTIRRDVDQLAAQGVVIKTLGGVQKADAPSYFYETSARSRLSVQALEKRAIAKQAIALVESKQTIFLDGSTTCLRLAKELAQQRESLTIVTNSALACMELGRNDENMVIGIGGQYDHDTASFVGPTSEKIANDFFVDLAFVSTKGFVPDEGTFESSIANFRIKQIFARQCAKLVLLVDHAKFGQRALCKVLDVSQIQVIVTDDKTPASEIESLRQQGKEVRVASLKDERLESTVHAS